MAWTKMKTVLITGLAVVLAAGTTGMVVKHHQQSNRVVAHFATPEAAFQSAFSAMSQGDLKTITASYTTEMNDKFMATAGKGKSDKELSALFTQIASMLAGYQVTSTETVSGDQLILHFRSPRFGAAVVPMRKIGADWKIDGNVTPDKAAGGR